VPDVVMGNIIDEFRFREVPNISQIYAKAVSAPIGVFDLRYQEIVF
jgi:hypothetical protein